MAEKMTHSSLESIEIKLLLDAIFENYGYDFRNYAKASIKRRVIDFIEQNKIAQISDLIPLILHDKNWFNLLLQRLSITVTEMFRDPQVYRFIRSNIIDVLRTYPFIKIWHAGCASGEEVYSFAIILEEEGLLDRAQIYATDFNNIVVKKAKEGLIEIKKIIDYSKNYIEAGGKYSLSKYYKAKYNSVMINKDLLRNTTFANHNLITDNVFGEMHLIFCRNVMIYFNKELQQHVFDLFDNSLINKGYLCLGTKESIKFSKLEKDYKIIGNKEKIFQKFS